MKYNVELCLLFLFLFVSVGQMASDGAPDEHKSEDTGSEDYGEVDFKENVPKKVHFIMFYAPWCGHCKRLKPVWKELSDEVNADPEQSVSVVKVDCTKETKLCSDEGVTGYPTLKLYQPDKEPQRHKGARDIDSLRNFINAALKPAEEVTITHTNGLYDLTKETFESHVSTGMHFIKFFAPWCGHCRRLEPVWLELAGAHIPSDSTQKDVKIGRVDCTEHKMVCSDYKVQGYPTLLWFEDGRMIKKYQGARDLKTFEDFIEDLKNSEREKEGEALKPPPPKPTALFEDAEEQKEKESPVVQLGEKNFDFNIAVDVTFVKFYAPWCGFCKRLAPIWEELAVEDFSAISYNIKIAKIDCTENKELCQKYEVKGYPTLLLFKDGDMVAKYSGSRTVKDFKSFIITTAAAENDVQAKEEL